MEWEERHRALIGRLAGLFLLAGLALGFGFADPAHSSTKLFSNISTQQIIDWASHNRTGISVEAVVRPLQSTLWAIAFVLLIGLIRGGGVLAGLTYVSAASFMALAWVHSAVMLALTEAAQQTGGDGAAVALFKLAKTLGLSDGVSFGIAVGCISIVVLLTRRLPIPIAWLGCVAAVGIFLGGPAQLILAGTIGGTDPAHFSLAGVINLLTGVALPILWILGTSLVLLIKPVRGVKSDATKITAEPAGRIS